MVRFCVRGIGVGPLAGLADGADRVADPQPLEVISQRSPFRS